MALHTELLYSAEKALLHSGGLLKGPGSAHRPPLVCPASSNCVPMPGVRASVAGAFPCFLPSCSGSVLFSSTHQLSAEVRIAVGGQVCACLSLITQMGGPRLRGVKSPAQRHSTAEWQSLPGPPSKSPSPYSLLSTCLRSPPHRLSGKPHSLL